jgi:2-keto-4-pentenoate hydratase/2-oxohepta-3-ene-1,7-dioic acid hydratase in catechol pathway
MLNGMQLTEFHTNHMVFGVVDYLAAMPRYLTLHPSDVVWMGTEGATQNMQHGDTIEVEINQIGTLRNPVVREA